MPRARFLAAACAALLVPAAPAAGAYAPKLAVALDPPRAGAPVGLRTTVTQAPGESATRSIELAFPRGFSARVPGPELPACAAGSERACPPESALGTVEAATLLGTFRGPVSYGGFDEQGRMRVVAILSNGIGMFDQAFVGHVTITPEGFRARFDGLPSLPVTRLVLSLAGAPTGLLTSPPECGSLVFAGAFESHRGEAAKASAPVEVSGCPNAAPRIARMSLLPTRVPRGRPTTVSFALSEPATVIVSVRRGRRGRRLQRELYRVGTGTTRVHGVARRVPAGRYSVEVRAVDAEGGVGKARRWLRVRRR